MMRKIAITGNPNTGKSSIFNQLTGLRQKVGNFPGVTVEKKTGTFQPNEGTEVTVIDLPGTYSIFPQSDDERVVFDFVSKQLSDQEMDLFVYVADELYLERNLLLFTQLYDLGLPMVLVLTMKDIAEEREVSTDTILLSKELCGVPVLEVNGRTGEGLEQLHRFILEPPKFSQGKKFGLFKPIELDHDQEAQLKDTTERYGEIQRLLSRVQKPIEQKSELLSRKIDRIAVHPVWGYAIFLSILFLIFQVIYHIASYPMDWIDTGFLQISLWLQENMPPGVFTDLIAEGVVPGIGGVLVFIPQIALLFFFLSLLEESGYMSRVVFIMDKLVRPFGLNGKSVVPLMSSVACAIPGIMSARGISSWKDRIITIMVAPLMSCSARIPVYTLLIALVIPDQPFLGIFNLKGIVLLGLYVLGLVSALLVAGVMKFFIRSKDTSFLIMEMPEYKVPVWRYVFIHLWEKVRIFVFDAGKVILAISIILWALASYGPSVSAGNEGNSSETSGFLHKVEHIEDSYIGKLGHGIEPVIKPLGYDWKIGIALITSFAAREVFVGSMATIYSVGEDFEEDDTLINRLREEKNPETGLPQYNLASGVSLLLFYVYAMQCMATFAVVKRETHSWKWPIIQLVYMGILAYLAAFIAYQFLS
jgi:ferrous iron transport protein B